MYVIKIEPYVVLSGSMEPKIQTGSLCFINKNTSFDSIKENDVIAFKLSGDVLVTHRVVEKTNDGLVTKGDANEVNDASLVNKTNFVGKNIFHIPLLGYFVSAIQSTTGKVIFLSFVALLFVLAFVVEEPKNKKVKEEETKEKDKEKEE